MSSEKDLADRPGERSTLFMDIDIAPGRHFGRALTEAVEGCDVVVVLIGPTRPTATSRTGADLADVNISASSVTAIYWLLLDAVVALPGAAAYLMMRGRFGRAALWPAGPG
jgi:hypothetical protein